MHKILCATEKAKTSKAGSWLCPSFTWVRPKNQPMLWSGTTRKHMFQPGNWAGEGHLPGYLTHSESTLPAWSTCPQAASPCRCQSQRTWRDQQRWTSWAMDFQGNHRMLPDFRYIKIRASGSRKKHTLIHCEGPNGSYSGSRISKLGRGQDSNQSPKKQKGIQKAMDYWREQMNLGDTQSQSKTRRPGAVLGAAG